jgi:hypothetical protein
MVEENAGILTSKTVLQSAALERSDSCRAGSQLQCSLLTESSYDLLVFSLLCESLSVPLEDGDEKRRVRYRGRIGD